MIKYAQLDTTGKCVGISYLSGEVKSDLLVPLKDDENYLGWTYSKGKWNEPEEKEDTKNETSEITIEEMVKAIYEKLFGKEQNNE